LILTKTRNDKKRKSDMRIELLLFETLKSWIL